MLTKLIEEPERDPCDDALLCLKKLNEDLNCGDRLVFSWNEYTYTVQRDFARRLLTGTLSLGIHTYNPDILQGMTITSTNGGLKTIHFKRLSEDFFGSTDMVIPLNVAAVTLLRGDEVRIVKEGTPWT